MSSQGNSINNKDGMRRQKKDEYIFSYKLQTETNETVNKPIS